jgi:ribose 5-phosphate isomerase B
MDTLRERKITIVREGRTAPDDLSLAPPADIRSLAIASDHTGVTLRRDLVAWLRGRGLAVTDHGTDSAEPVDYPDIAAVVARAVARGEADAGIVIDGAGIGSAIAANKLRGVRAVMATTETIARYSREHNGANVLTLGASLVTPEEARGILVVWLSTPMREPRYIRRLAKIRDLEQLT